MPVPKLLLDEPPLGLSPVMTHEVGFIKKQIVSEGVPILLIEQNASLALSLASKCCALETGIIGLEGDAKQFQDNEHIKKAYLGI